MEQIRKGKQLKRVVQGGGSAPPEKDKESASSSFKRRLSVVRNAISGDNDYDDDYDDDYEDQNQARKQPAPGTNPAAAPAVAAAPVNPVPTAPPPPPRKSPPGTAASVNPAPAPAVAAADTAAPPPDPAPAKDQLLEQIRKGKRLKKAEDRKIPQAAQQAAQSESNDMGRTMLNAFAARFNSSQNRYKNRYISSEDATKMLTQLCKEVKNLNSESGFEKYSEEIKNFDEGLSRSLTSQNNVSEREALEGLQNKLEKLKEFVGEFRKTNDKNKRKRILAGVDGIVKSINGEWE